MKNIQITIDPETLAAVDRVGQPLGLKRSEIIRRALREWLQRQSVARFEQEWIERLHEKGDDAARAEEWIGIQAWSRK